MEPYLNEVATELAIGFVGAAISATIVATALHYTRVGTIKLLSHSHARKNRGRFYYLESDEDGVIEKVGSNNPYKW